MTGGTFFVVSLCFLGIISLIKRNEGAVNFTQVPPAILYVSSGATAKFVWNYHVDDRNTEFYTTSPEWYYSNGTGKTRVAAEVKKYVNGSFEWIWSVSPLCPARLKHRLSKESNATLVISNVSVLDNGNYQCELVLSGVQSTIIGATQLIVTVPPSFLPNHPKNEYRVYEGQDFMLNCTAIGPPTPDITWVNISDGSVVNKGKGSAVIHVNNRNHAGRYECQAKNNPNEAATTIRTIVKVYYRPDINTTASPNKVSCVGSTVQLVCKANGEPKPSMTLKNSSGHELHHKDGKGEISYSIEIKNRSQFDNYTCIASNRVGNASHVISLKDGPCPTSTSSPGSGGSGTSVPAGIIAGVVIAGILAIAGLIIALVFCYRRKTLEKDRRSGSTQERTVQMSSLSDQEHYASVQHQQDDQEPTTEPISQYAIVNKRKKKGPPAEELPQYAQVNKSTKKRHDPNEIVYADLALDSKDEFESRPTSTRNPTNEDNTLYADITGNRQRQLEPQYGNLHGRDIFI